MAISTLTIDSIAGNGNIPAVIVPPGDWQVLGQVVVTGANITLDAMAYQIDDGQVNPVAVPESGTAYSFPLPGGDLPRSGIYLLTVFAWDSGDASVTPAVLPAAATATLQLVIEGVVVDHTGGPLE